MVDRATATLTMREREMGPREMVPDSEWELARAELKDGQLRLVPSNIDLYLKSGFRPGWIYEFIYGTEEQRRWRQKVANLLVYANGPYQETFETRSLTIAVPTTAGDRRLLELLSWTKAELQARHEEAQGDLFLFASIPAAAMDAERVFLTPCWYQAFKQDPVALLETPWNS